MEHPMNRLRELPKPDEENSDLPGPDAFVICLCSTNP
jgi:hypothetical protein